MLIYIFFFFLQFISSKLAKDLTKEHPQVDYTPPSYITLLFTDLGILTPSAVTFKVTTKITVFILQINAVNLIHTQNFITVNTVTISLIKRKYFLHFINDMQDVIHYSQVLQNF